jgi:hypothetical protein
MRRRPLVLALALAALGTMPSVALAQILGTERVEWPNRDVLVHLRLHSIGGPQLDPQEVRGEFLFEDYGADNTHHVRLERLQMIIDRAPRGGSTSVLRESPFDQKNYSAGWFLRATNPAPCLHPIEQFGGVRDGDTVWVRAQYRIFWRDGSATAWRYDASHPITFQFSSQCI